MSGSDHVGPVVDDAGQSNSGVVQLETEHNKSPTTLAERIRVLRQHARLGQRGFAAKIREGNPELECNQARVSRWERGEGRPGSDELRAIGEQFSVDGNWLLYGTGVPPPAVRRFGGGVL